MSQQTIIIHNRQKREAAVFTRIWNKWGGLHKNFADFKKAWKK